MAEVLCVNHGNIREIRDGKSNQCVPLGQRGMQRKMDEAKIEQIGNNIVSYYLTCIVLLSVQFHIQYCLLLLSKTYDKLIICDIESLSQRNDDNQKKVEQSLYRLSLNKHHLKSTIHVDICQLHNSQNPFSHFQQISMMLIIDIHY